MKHLSKYIVVGAIALSATACNDSFLERTPTNDLNDATYWTNISDLEAYTNGIYNEAAHDGTYKIMTAFGATGDPYQAKVRSTYPREAMSDNFATNDASQTWASAVAAGIENVPSGNTNYGGWSWGLLRRINVFLQNYNRVKAEDVLKNRYAGEALFFRAWFYFYMVQTYGDVPLITKPLETDSEELYGPRTPRKEVMKQILQDINDACSYLPANAWGANRLTKGAALALKSRIGLYEGTYRKYHGLGDEVEFLNACVSASEELMGMNYEIHNTGKPNSDYTDLFTTDDLASNKEVIFYRNYVADLRGHRMCGYVINIRNGATKDFADDFLRLDSDGKARPIALSTEYSNDTPEEEFANRDPRMGQTLLAPAYVPVGTEDKDIDTPAKKLFKDHSLHIFSFPRIGNMERWPTLTGYHTIKYYTWEQDKKGFGKETQDYPLFRYAEVLLNYAEAKAELGECGQDVLDKSINLLRDRVALPHLTVNPEMDPKYAAYGLSSLIIEIRRERRVELSFEYQRYYDLMRWAWGERLKERVLGMRLEDADLDNPRYDKRLTIAGREGAGQNAIYVFKAADGKQYIDAYGGTNYATERRSFDPKKDYLRPLPKSALTKNDALVQNPEWK